MNCQLYVFQNKDLHQNFALLINTEKLLRQSKNQLTVQLHVKQTDHSELEFNEPPKLIIHNHI